MKTREQWMEEARMEAYGLMNAGEQVTRETVRADLESVYQAQDVKEAVDEEGGIDEYFDTLWDYIEQVRAIWYAVMKDRDDDDWGYGSPDLEEAKRMCRKMGESAYIAVIDVTGGDSLCIDEIEQEDF